MTTWWQSLKSRHRYLQVWSKEGWSRVAFSKTKRKVARASSWLKFCSSLELYTEASIAQRQSTGLVNQGSWVRSSLEAATTYFCHFATSFESNWMLTKETTCFTTNHFTESGLFSFLIEELANCKLQSAKQGLEWHALPLSNRKSLSLSSLPCWHTFWELNQDKISTFLDTDTFCFWQSNGFLSVFFSK
jgi:hypothetical protein